MTHEVVSINGVADIQSFVANANEVNIGIVLVLLLHVRLDPVLDFLVWLPVKHDGVSDAVTADG